MKQGTKLGLTFEVVEGGFLDIDVRIDGMKQSHNYLITFVGNVLILGQALMVKMSTLERGRAMANIHLQPIWMASTSIVSQIR